METVTSVDQLEKLYGEPLERALWKEIDHINAHYRQFIEASPFLILATCGDNGVDCSPRGDPAGFVRIEDEKTILIPDRRGNNRLDTLRNIVVNPSVGLIFLIPSVGETIRISGEAEICVDNELCASFSIRGKPASSVLRINVQRVFYQCQKAIVRANLWSPASHVDRSTLPTSGQMSEAFARMQGVELDGQAYDKNYPEHMSNTIY